MRSPRVTVINKLCGNGRSFKAELQSIESGFESSKVRVSLIDFGLSDNKQYHTDGRPLDYCNLKDAGGSCLNSMGEECTKIPGDFGLRGFYHAETVHLLSSSPGHRSCEKI